VAVLYSVTLSPTKSLVENWFQQLAPTKLALNMKTKGQEDITGCQYNCKRTYARVPVFAKSQQSFVVV
jgi:hypothetical protein